MSDLFRLVRAFHDACHEAAVAYAFIGGFAVMAWGEPRATRDIDTLVEPDAEALERLAGRLKAKGLLVDPRDLQDARKDRAHVTVTDPTSHFHVDIKLARTDAEVLEVHEAVEVPWEDTHVRVATPEDTIAFKIAFGSEQDLKDARSIVWRQKDRLDDRRLRRAAARAGIGDRLDAFLNEAQERTD